MQYLEFTFTTTPSNEAIHDVLASELAAIGFDSFVHTASLEQHAMPHSENPEAPTFEEEGGTDLFKCFIQESLYSEEALKEALAAFPLPGVKIEWNMQKAENKDWNEEWEKNYFQPLVVDGRCVISGTFHKDVPVAEYNIKINPQMSFGTGHHATTSQMISRILTDDMTGKEVLDMGCGTSILAILARMRGAAHCRAIDVDEWCVNNSLENIRLNQIDSIDVELGDANSLTEPSAFDLVIANINLGILLNDLPQYVKAMKPSASIYMSGFYDTDIPQLVEKASTCGLSLTDTHVTDGWACLKFTKS